MFFLVTLDKLSISLLVLLPFFCRSWLKQCFRTPFCWSARNAMIHDWACIMLLVRTHYRYIYTLLLFFFLRFDLSCSIGSSVSYGLSRKPLLTNRPNCPNCPNYPPNHLPHFCSVRFSFTAFLLLATYLVTPFTLFNTSLKAQWLATLWVFVYTKGEYIFSMTVLHTVYPIIVPVVLLCVMHVVLAVSTQSIIVYLVCYYLCCCVYQSACLILHEWLHRYLTLSPFVCSWPILPCAFTLMVAVISFMKVGK